jgi:ribosomal protein S1
MIKSGRCLSEKEIDILKVIKEVYAQQKEMFDNHKHSVANRIVNLNQPHIRLIVRGKANAKTEFGAKVEIIVVDGYVRVEKLSWDAYNECDSLIEIVENFKTRTGKYPERVLVDKIYRNRKNLNFCKKNRTT